MHSPRSIGKPVEWPDISTGHLPQPESVQKLASTIPAGRLPGYRPGELPADVPPQPAGDDRQAAPAPAATAS